MNLSNEEKQLILYTKGHYSKSGYLIDDMKVIVGKAYALSFEHVEMYSIYNFAIKSYDKLVEGGYISHNKGTAEYILTKVYSKGLNREDNSLLEFMLGEISIIKVKGLELGEIDFEIQDQMSYVQAMKKELLEKKLSELR